MGYQDKIQRGYTAFEDFVEDVCGSMEDIYAKLDNATKDAVDYEDLLDWVRDATDDLARLINDIRSDNL